MPVQPQFSKLCQLLRPRPRPTIPLLIDNCKLMLLVLNLTIMMIMMDIGFQMIPRLLFKWILLANCQSLVPAELHEAYQNLQAVATEYLRGMHNSRRRLQVAQNNFRHVYKSMNKTKDEATKTKSEPHCPIVSATQEQTNSIVATISAQTATLETVLRGIGAFY